MVFLECSFPAAEPMPQCEDSLAPKQLSRAHVLFLQAREYSFPFCVSYKSGQCCVSQERGEVRKTAHRTEMGFQVLATTQKLLVTSPVKPSE